MIDSKQLPEIIGCLAVLAGEGRLTVFSKAQVVKMDNGQASATEFRVLGEDTREPDYVIFTNNGSTISRIKKEYVDVV